MQIIVKLKKKLKQAKNVRGKSTVQIAKKTSYTKVKTF